MRSGLRAAFSLISPGPFVNDDQLLRYSRHILLDEFGIDGQERVLAARALVIGAGGLGSPASLYLASAGVGDITIVDPDVVDLTNLQRQIAHTTARVGRAKVESAREAMGQINPEVRVHALSLRADDEALHRLVESADVVLDCSDNFSTRHAVNRACVAHRKPLVAGAAIRFDAQVSVFDTRDAHAPCYACLFPESADFEEVACATMGVFAPLVGIVGSIQANEALKLMAGIGTSLAGRLMMIDARTMAVTEMRAGRRHDCPVCSGR
jgi:molybdopterin/thiamine biosynthesis adenylyltransferase